jgi:hypothetical protein
MVVRCYAGAVDRPHSFQRPRPPCCLTQSSESVAPPVSQGGAGDLAPGGIRPAYSAISFARRSGSGAFCLIIVVFTHVAEAFSLFPRMGWGLPNSAGHYVDLVSAAAGLTLLPTGYLARLFLRAKTNP